MSQERRNVVLVTVDSLRADHCGFVGYGEDTTPTLDSMAEDGFVFENAIAPGPATPESMPAIFTGEYPVERTEQDEETSDLEARRERIRAHMEARDSLPERLRRLGYETAAFTPNPFTSRHFGFDAGFDQFEDFMDESNRGGLYQKVFNGFLEESTVSSLARVFLNFWQREEVFKPWESYYDDVVEWTQQVEEPYFLWVFLMDAHNPYMSSAEYRSQSRLQAFHANVEFWRQSHETPFSDGVHEKLVTAYDDSIRYSDAFLEQLRADLAEDDPVITVHGDHGEAFGEHGTYGHEPYLYPENVHVPLVASGLESGSVDAPVSLKSLPDVLVSLAQGTPVRSSLDDSPFARSRTRQGNTTGVVHPNWTYVNGSDGEHAVATDVDVGDGGLAEAVRPLAVADDEALEERARIASAVGEVAEL